MKLGNTPCRRTFIIRDITKILKQDLLLYLPYLLDLTLSNFYLFSTIPHSWTNFEEMQHWLDELFLSSSFYCRGIHILPKTWQKCVADRKNPGKNLSRLYIYTSKHWHVVTLTSMGVVLSVRTNRRKQPFNPNSERPSSEAFHSQNAPYCYQEVTVSFRYRKYVLPKGIESAISCIAAFATDHTLKNNFINMIIICWYLFLKTGGW